MAWIVTLKKVQWLRSNVTVTSSGVGPGDAGNAEKLGKI